MKKTRLALPLMAALVGAAPPGAATDTPWSVAHSVERTRIVHDPDYPGGIDRSFDGSRAIRWSPDRGRFFFSTIRGDLASDTNRAELIVYSADDVARSFSGAALRPISHVTAASESSNELRQPIMSPAWMNDRVIAYRSDNALFTLDTGNGVATRISTPGQDVVAFHARGNAIIYLVRGAPEQIVSRYPAYSLNSRPDALYFALNPSGPISFYSVQLGRSPQFLATSAGNHSPPTISPDGRWAIMLISRRGQRWGGYERPLIDPVHYVLIDLEAGTLSPVIDAPFGYATQAGRILRSQGAIWSPDNRRVIILNTALPLDDHHPERRSTPYAVEYSVETRDWRVLTSMALRDSDGRLDGAERRDMSGDQAIWQFAWLDGGARIRATLGASAAGGSGEAPRTVRSMDLHLVDGAWVEQTGASAAAATAISDAARAAPSGLEVSLRQDANSPPAVIARYRGRERQLSAADPVIAAVRRATVERIRWVEHDGRETEAGLMLPPDGTAHRNLPLVIQAYAFRPNLFWPEGSATSAFAAQALAAKGFAVLQMSIPSDGREVMNIALEGRRFAERIDGAVAALERRGLVDPRRVALVGFSRSAMFTSYVIANPGRVRLAAAVAADGWDASYGQYLTHAAMLGPRGNLEAEQMYGGPFWGAARDEWVRRAPSFNIDRITTPILFTHHWGQGATGRLHTELLGAYRLNSKPFDYYVFRDGDHQLQRPRERAESMQLTIDWIDFWLNGRAPEAPDRAERWQAMRRNIAAGPQNAPANPPTPARTH